EPRERRERRGAVAIERAHPRTSRAREHVERDERVADENEVAIRKQECRAAGAVAGYMDRTRATGDVDDLAIGERTDLEDRRWGPQHPRADRERDEPQRAEPQRALPLRRLRLACERDVVRVHADRDAALLAD